MCVPGSPLYVLRLLFPKSESSPLESESKNLYKQWEDTMRRNEREAQNPRPEPSDDWRTDADELLPPPPKPRGPRKKTLREILLTG